LVIDLKTPLTTNNYISKIEPADEGSVIIGGDALMTEQNQTSVDDRNAESVRAGAQQQRPKTQQAGLMPRAYKINAVNKSAANFYNTNVDFRRQSAQSMTKMMRTGSTFKYSQNHYRKSFFDQIPGANENRFIAFNDMPYNSSKYALNSQLTRATTDFSK
jgi:hypothetical protein